VAILLPERRALVHRCPLTPPSCQYFYLCTIYIYYVHIAYVYASRASLSTDTTQLSVFVPLYFIYIYYYTHIASVHTSRASLSTDTPQLSVFLPLYYIYIYITYILHLYIHRVHRCALTPPSCQYLNFCTSTASMYLYICISV
jgi:hypothetical protein